jgi:hypothetical protein
MTLCVILASCAVAGPAAAHHSSVMFDLSREIVLEGVVTEYKWQNPHPYLTIRTAGSAAEPVEQVIEVGPPSTLQPFGLTEDSLRVGDEVVVRANPAKRGNIVLGRELIKADRTVLPLLRHPGAPRPDAVPARVSPVDGTAVPAAFAAMNANRRAHDD